MLDSCALVALSSGTLPPVAAREIEECEQVFVPSAVVWELAIKAASRKISFGKTALEWAREIAVRHSLSIGENLPDIATLCAAAALPLIHRDPFDRLLIAVAIQNDFTLVTSDHIIPTYPGVKTLW